MKSDLEIRPGGGLETAAPCLITNRLLIGGLKCFDIAR
jgi:hypothetical protein